MTREEFMKHAQEEIENAFRGQRNRMMNLVEQAWAEGKRNAETEQINEIGKELADSLTKLVLPWQPSITTDKTISNIPEACKHCLNHPINGGSGNCNCISGSQPITVTI